MCKNIIFWLEYPLFHIAPLIKSLSLRKDVNVIVITEFDIPQWRLDMGFLKPDFGLAKEIFCPNQKERSKLINESSSSNNYHIFHGLRHVKENYKCFKSLINTEAFVGLYFEPQQLTGSIKARLRELYYRSLFLRYGARIKFMLALGELGANQYINLGLPEKKVFLFEYHFDKPSGELSGTQSNKKLTFLYAGRLIELKNLALILEAFSSIVKNGFSKFEFLIIGDGVQQGDLKNYVIKNNLSNNVRFLSSIPSEDLNKYYLNADAFILASKFEGWGAVATEAMSFGLPLIISDGCASSCIVKEDYHGVVFENNSVKSLEKSLVLFMESSEQLTSDSNRKRRVEYAIQNLSGEAGSKKLINILSGISNMD